MEYTPQIFLNLINSKQTLPQVISIIGEEIYFRMQILTALTENVFADVELQDREIHHFEKDLDLNALEQTINSYPFFGGHTLVIIQDEKFFEVNKNGISDAMAKRLEKVTEILDNVPEYCTVILALSKLDKRIKFYKKIGRKKCLLSHSCRQLLSQVWLVLAVCFIIFQGLHQVKLL